MRGPDQNDDDENLDHFVTSEETIKMYLEWCPRLELNQLPRPYQGLIHPYELQGHLMTFYTTTK